MANKRRYSTEERMATLKLVELSGSIDQTAKDTGVPKHIINYWLEAELVKMKKPIDFDKIEQKINDTIEDKESQFLTKVYNAKITALNKMETLIEKSTNLREVTETFAVLSNVQIGSSINGDAKNGQQIINNVKNSIQQRIYMVKKGRTGTTRKNDEQAIIVE